jgi:hypothetical protein
MITDHQSNPEVTRLPFRARGMPTELIEGIIVELHPKLTH